MPPSSFHISTTELAHIVRQLGIGGAVEDYPANRIEDDEIARLWGVARDAMDAIEGMLPEVEWDEGEPDWAESPDDDSDDDFRAWLHGDDDTDEETDS
jgi:hypothetical protein